MKPQQLAKLLNVADSTLRLWAGKEYAEFLSPTAQGPNGARRSFGDTDARILAWVALMRAQNTPMEDIRNVLRQAQSNNWHNLPPLPGGMAVDEPVAMVPREAVEERLRAVQDRYDLQLEAAKKEREELLTQRSALQERLSKTELENAELRQTLIATNTQLLELNRRLTSMLEKEHRRRK